MPDHSHPHAQSVLHTASEATTLAVQPAVLQHASCTVQRSIGDQQTKDTLISYETNTLGTILSLSTWPLTLGTHSVLKLQTLAWDVSGPLE